MTLPVNAQPFGETDGRACHRRSQPAPAPVDHASRTAWGRTVRQPRSGGPPERQPRPRRRAGPEVRPPTTELAATFGRPGPRRRRRWPSKPPRPRAPPAAGRRPPAGPEPPTPVSTSSRMLNRPGRGHRRVGRRVDIPGRRRPREPVHAAARRRVGQVRVRRAHADYWGRVRRQPEDAPAHEAPAAAQEAPRPGRAPRRGEETRAAGRPPRP